MSQTTKLTFKQGMAFEVELQGHRFLVDADEAFGGRNAGPRPKALLLSALAGCTGMDVVSILDKMRVPFDHFDVEVQGELTDTPPKVFKTLHIRYVVRGRDVDRSKVERAVELSLSTYCGVSAMLKGTAAISHEIVVGPA